MAAAAQQVRDFSSMLGENDSATIAAKANLDALKTEYRASAQEVKKLAGQNTALQKSAQNAADAVNFRCKPSGTQRARRRLPWRRAVRLSPIRGMCTRSRS